MGHQGIRPEQEVAFRSEDRPVRCCRATDAKGRSGPGSEMVGGGPVRGLLARREWIRALLGSGLGLLVAGCAAWRPAPRGTAEVNTAERVSLTKSTNIVMAVMVLEYRDHEYRMVEEMWAESDQLAVQPEVRRVLDANGLRATLLSSHIHGSLGQLLVTELPMIADALPDFADSPDLEGMATRSRLQGIRMHFQPGHHREVPVSGTFGVVDWEIGDGERLTRGSASNSRAVVQLTAESAGEERVRLEVLPGFREQHAQPVFGAGTRDFEFSSRQVFHSLPGMAFDVVLRRGQTLVLGPLAELDRQKVPPPLGETLFGDDPSAGYSGLRRLLMIRLVSVPGV